MNTVFWSLEEASPYEGDVSTPLHKLCPWDSFTQSSGPEDLGGFAIPDPGISSEPVYHKAPSQPWLLSLSGITGIIHQTLGSRFTSQEHLLSVHPISLPTINIPLPTMRISEGRSCVRGEGDDSSADGRPRKQQLWSQWTWVLLEAQGSPFI